MTLHQILIALVAIPALGALATVATLPATQRADDTRKEPTPKARPGVYVRDSSSTMIPLRIRTLDVSVDVKGAMATTTFDITVYNPHDRVLEGEFSFPLTDGQTVSRFALDINGALREGVVVTKEKGRVAYEATIRQRIDPALLEWTNDNAFRTRIYPIPARGTRRIVIAYEQPLTGDRDGYTYRMPFAYDQQIDTFRLHAMVAGFGTKPSLAGDGGETVAFSPRGREFLAELMETDVQLNSAFTLSVPVIAGRTYHAVSTFDGISFVGMFLSGRSYDRSTPTKRIAELSLVVDASLSAASRDRKKDQEFLNAMFKHLGNVKVHLITFAHRPLSTESYNVTQGNWTSVRTAMERIRYDGATQLGSVPFSSMQGQYIVLLSDGISTIGVHDPEPARVPVLCVTSGVQADHDVLRGIAQRSGGKVIDITTKDVASVVPNLFVSTPVISEFNVLDGEIDQIRPLPPIAASDMTTIAGVLGSSSATVELVTTLDGRVIHRDTVSISDRSSNNASMARLWAQLELQRLNMDRRRNAHAIENVGKRFTIVTPGTSLIVLDRLEDYVLHRIPPPASEPDMAAEYITRVQQLQSDSAQMYRAHLDNVVSAFRERQKWYHEQIPNPVDVARALSSQQDDRVSNEFGNASPGITGKGNTVITRAKPEIVRLLSMQAGIKASGNNFIVRGSRTTENQVLVDGLLVADSFVGGFADQGVASAGSDAAPKATGTITLTTPVQRASYLEKLTTASATSIYDRYHELRYEHGKSTAFYIDVADMLREKGDSLTALRVLSNLAELHGESAPTLRILGYRLRQLGHHALAVMVFEDVLRVRGEEPQSYRDLGLALADAGRKQDACDRLYELVLRSWDSRFPEIELIALHEFNSIIADTHSAKVNTEAYDPRLLVHMPVGMRVVLSWDADNCDMDLWVTDPTGEKCYYSHRKTMIGGSMSRDLTGGYGPEEFILKTPMKGTYNVQVQYYGNSQLRLAGPTTIHVDLSLHAGTPEASKRSITTRVDGVRRVVDIGTFTIK